MKPFYIAFAASLLFMILMVPYSWAQDMHQQSASEIIQDWPETSKKTSQTIIEKYGEPDVMHSEMLVWFGNGDWNKTVIQREEIDHDFPVPHKDVMYQEIDYEVPEKYFTMLAEYDGSVIVERTKGTIAARCDKEAANYLALNLAVDIIEGEKSVMEARQYYADTIKKMMKGEKPEYMTGFVFDLPQGDTGDPDEALIKKQ